MRQGWSYSHYSTALECLRKYKHLVIDKLEVDVPKSGDQVFGSALHSAINSMLLGDEGEQVFNLFWGSYKDKELDYGRFNWNHLQSIGEEFLRKFRKLHLQNYKLIFAEERLYGKYKELKVEGTPDYYGLYKGKTCLRDFKTSNSNYPKEKSLLATQLYMYAYLYKSEKKEYPETLGYTVFNKALGSIQDITWNFNEKKMIEVLDEMWDYCVMVENNNHSHPKNLNVCMNYGRRCQFFDICHKEGK